MKTLSPKVQYDFRKSVTLTDLSVLPAQAYLLSLPDLTQEQIAHKMKQNLRGELTADMKEEPRILDDAHYGHV